MNRTVAVLALTTTLFGASTVWLAIELHRRADVPVAAATPVAASKCPEMADHRSLASPARSTSSPSVGSAPSSSPVTHGAPETQANSTAAGEKKSESSSDSALSFARQFLARFDDSAQRSLLLDEARTSVRRQYSRLKDQLKLGDATFNELVTLLAEQNLKAQERWARCEVTPGCDLNDPSRVPPLHDPTQELLALLGAEQMDAFNQYRDSITERDTVAQFRGRLTDANFLPESQAERLIAALADERKRFTEEAAQRGARLNGWGTNLGMIWYPDDIGSVEQRLAEAAAYSQRLQTRAAGVLTPAQLALFVQIQEELLAQMAAYLRPAPRKSDPTKLAQG